MLRLRSSSESECRRPRCVFPLPTPRGAGRIRFAQCAEGRAPHLPNQCGRAWRRRGLFDGSFEQRSERTEFHGRASGGLLWSNRNAEQGKSDQPLASARRNPKGSLRETWAHQPCTPDTSFASRAQRKPIQFILVLGSVPLRCAPRTLGVLSIQPPPRKLRCVPFSGPLGFLSGAVA